MEHVDKSVEPFAYVPMDATLRPWQQAVVRRAQQGWSATGQNGIWLSTPSNSGKTFILAYLLTHFRDNVYTPDSIRYHGGYDAGSFKHYKGEGIIAFDGMEPTIRATNDRQPRFGRRFITEMLTVGVNGNVAMTRCPLTRAVWIFTSNYRMEELDWGDEDETHLIMSQFIATRDQHKQPEDDFLVTTH
jgi:hypothetical protein